MALNNKVSSIIPIIRGLIRDQIDSSGRDSFVYLGDNKFPLCKDFINGSTIEICLNGVALSTDDWSYNSSKNIVTINIVSSGISLDNGDLILISYSFYKKFSDAEIKQYIQSSFAFFVEYRYKKTFCLSTNDYIITLDGINPNSKELYFISIIASILIDPQNIRVRTDEFTITANRDMSDTEQIADAFAKYQSFIGSVDNFTDNDNFHRSY